MYLNSESLTARPPKKRSRKKKKVRDGDDSEYSDQRPAPPAKSSKRPRRKHRKVPPVVKSRTSLFIRSDIVCTHVANHRIDVPRTVAIDEGGAHATR